MSVEDVQDASIVEANMDDSSDDDALINLVGQARPAPARGCARGGRGRARGRGRGRGRSMVRDTEAALAEGWQKTEDVAPPDVQPFTGACGPTEILPPNTPAIDFLMQLLGDDFFSSVAHATNCNAVLKSPPAHPDPGSPYATSDPHWHVATADDIKAFVGINICMGLKEMSEYSDYWNTSPVLNDPFVSSSVMSKRRYEKLCRYLHCAVPGEEDAAYKLTKVRPFIIRCDERFDRFFKASQNVSVDEAMIQFNGRLSWKQYLPMKPVKWGLKLWCLCDASTGYCIRFRVYTGAEEGAGMDLGYRVVMGLMQPYLGKYHHVFADNYFTSVHLAEALLRDKTYLCGTTRSNRKEYPKAASATREVYEVDQWERRYACQVA